MTSSAIVSGPRFKTGRALNVKFVKFTLPPAASCILPTTLLALPKHRSAMCPQLVSRSLFALSKHKSAMEGDGAAPTWLCCVACRRGFASRGLACQRAPLGAVAEGGVAMPSQDIPKERKPGPFSPGRQSILVSPGAGLSHTTPKFFALTGNYFVHRGARYLLTPSEDFRAGAPRL